MRIKRTILSVVLAGALYPVGIADSALGSLCIAPGPELPKSPDGQVVLRGELFCEVEKLSLKIDSQPTRPWPVKSSARIDGLDLKVSHRVVIFCEGKAQQSFRFSYSEFKSRELCLFINDLYGTVQLWEKKRSPWCKCK